MTISTSSDALAHPRAATVTVEASSLRVAVEDGRARSASHSPGSTCSAKATEDKRRDFTLIGGGAGIWWEALDDGISVPRLFGLPEDL
jgi:hypothetical protein